MLIPSIDLYDGKAVQWRQGRERVLEVDDVFGLLDHFSLYGDVAIIDLNAATGHKDNRDLICALLRRHACRVGGGIRDLDTAKFYLQMGASKIILGTAARESFVTKLPKETLIFALDSRGEKWLTQGWSHETDLSTQSVLEELAPRCSEFLYTQVEKEGMMGGLDRRRVEQIVKASPVPVTAAGGITTIDDVVFLKKLGARAQIGMALYTGRLSLDDSLLATVAFDEHPLIPTVVQDEQTRDVLMLAYSNRESLSRAMSERRGIYFSRSRQKLWRKGESSGNIQELRRVDVDCDGDTLLFIVRQQGPACHLGTWSCFPSVEKRFSLNRLESFLARRVEQRPTGSYSSRLAADPQLRAAKLREETEELIEAVEPAHVAWETADLIYHALMDALSKGVRWRDVENQLRSRHANP